ncbi:hypothetical protein CDCA_CDCA14G3747 [Cyanidium caldarium]|uniref:Uncharacterized protein n=1 Tax=Cyanidium caldarium TaxID=2771 RepID=A0AAV9IZF5_CYACA|nr:hypothetical protein CDCA_CDCA14G3747 [Cyanidium caldarium]
MNDAQVQQQIQQMVSFIRQDAEEKINELEVKAEEEFNIRKLKTIEEQCEKIRAEYARKMRQAEAGQRISYSAGLNAARLRVLKERETGLRQVYEEVRERLLRASAEAPERYRALLLELMAQGIFLMRQEGKMMARVRPQDAALAESLLSAALQRHDAIQQAVEEAQRREEGGEECVTVDGASEAVQVSVDRQMHLSKESAGGVLLISADGKVQCDNTLEIRLDIAYQQSLPHLRQLLFGDTSALQADGAL